MRLLTTCLLAALALPASAEIYKYTDANGNTVFTNQPPEGVGAETVTLPPTNTVEPPPNIPLPGTDDDDQDADGQLYNTLALTGIPDDEALRANNGTFSVGVEIEPRLRPGHSLRLILDGEPHGQPSNVPMLQVTEAARGEHSLAVEVLAGDKPIQRSAAETFTIQRVHTSSPALRPPPPPPPKAKPTP